MASSDGSAALLSLPPEVLLNICKNLTTPSFIQLTSTCQKLFHLAEASREVLLQHLNDVPGIKLGLEDHALSTRDLWLLLRQRASAHLYGAHFNADCSNHTFRSGELNTSGSCAVDSLGEIHFSLVCRDDLQIRHYGALCTPIDITPSPYADGLGRVIQVVRHGHFITVLYAWQQPKSHHSSSHSSPLPHTLPPYIPKRATRVIAKAEESIGRDRSISSSSDETPKTRYHLVHYDIYNHDHPVFFTIKPLKPSQHKRAAAHHPTVSTLEPIPVHLSVYNRLKVAITWSESHIGLRTHNLSLVVLYIADRIPARSEEGTYTSFKLYPQLQHLIPPSPPPEDISAGETRAHRDAIDRFEKDRKYYRLHRPAATRFRLQGTRLSLYAVGGTVPFATATIDSASASTLANAPLSRTYDRIVLEGNYFCMDSAFWGVHHFSSTTSRNNDSDNEGNDDAAGLNPDDECTHVYLHLAIMLPFSPDHEPGAPPRALVVIQARCPTPSDECCHYVDLDSGQMPTRGMRGWESRVVARLWGWKPPELSTMTGMDTVAVSKGGTRVAVSYWDRVLVWSLDPAVLGEEWGDDEEDSSESEQDSEGEGGDGVAEVESTDGNDTASDVGSAAEPGGHAQAQNVDDAQSAGVTEGSEVVRARRGMIRATRYYKTTKDRRLGEIVELKPIVIKLAGGAVARKMVWKHPETRDDDDDVEEEEDGEHDNDSDVSEEDEAAEMVYRASSSQGQKSNFWKSFAARMKAKYGNINPVKIDNSINAFKNLPTKTSRLEFLCTPEFEHRERLMDAVEKAARRDTDEDVDLKTQRHLLNELTEMRKVKKNDVREAWAHNMLSFGNKLMKERLRLVELAQEQWFEDELAMLVEMDVEGSENSVEKEQIDHEGIHGVREILDQGNSTDIGETEEDELLDSSEPKGKQATQIRSVKPSVDWGKNKLLEPTIEEIDDMESIDGAATTENPTIVSITDNAPDDDDEGKSPSHLADTSPSLLDHQDNTAATLSSLNPSSSDVSTSNNGNTPRNTISHLIHSIEEPSSHRPQEPETIPSDGGSARANNLSSSDHQHQRRLIRLAKGKAPIRDTINASLTLKDILAAPLPPAPAPAPAADSNPGETDTSTSLLDLNTNDADDGEVVESTRTQSQSRSRTPPPPRTHSQPHSPPSHPPSLTHAKSTEAPIKARPKKRKKRIRVTEDELTILTDRGVQVWNMGVWAKGRREEGWIEDFKGWGREGDGED